MIGAIFIAAFFIGVACGAAFVSAVIMDLHRTGKDPADVSD